MAARKKILLIDDEKIFHFVNTKILSLTGVDCDIHGVFNGKEALEYLTNVLETSAFPDIIIVDVNMPFMDGFEFIEAYRTLPITPSLNVRIIILTSSPNQEEMQKARDLGVDFIMKPLSLEDATSILTN